MGIYLLRQSNIKKMQRLVAGILSCNYLWWILPASQVCFYVKKPQKFHLKNPMVMTNSSPWFLDGPNRNRRFTVLKNGGSFHGKLLNNQMVN